LFSELEEVAVMVSLEVELVNSPGRLVLLVVIAAVGAVPEEDESFPFVR